MIDLGKTTILELSSRIEKKEVKVNEIIESSILKAKTVGNKLNCFITVCEESSKQESEKIDNLIKDNQKLPILAGIPIALKDIYSTNNIKTTAASRVLENYIPPYDATVTSLLKEELTVMVGKTNLDAWAHGSSGENSDFGPTLNPYDLRKVSGGSSSGSAAAVAAGIVLSATGTDTGGSIRLPASFCNIVGLKPTYGRVSRYGIIAMASSLDSIGHFTKTVYDNALILNATALHDPYDSTSANLPKENFTKNINHGVKNLKIGLPKEYFSQLDPKIKNLVLKATKKLEYQGAKIIDVSLPHTKYGVATYYIIQPAEVSSNLARYDGIRFGFDRSKFSDEAKRRIVLGTFTLSSGYYDAYYLKAMKVRRLIRSDFTDAFKKVDVMICPTSPALPFNIGEKTDDPLKMYLSDIFTVNINLAGIPSLAIPCGFEDELPVGMQIIGPDFSESLLYQVAYAYEQETKWYERTPKI